MFSHHSSLSFPSPFSIFRRTRCKHSAEIPVVGRFTSVQSVSWRCDDVAVSCPRVSRSVVQNQHPARALNCPARATFNDSAYPLKEASPFYALLKDFQSPSIEPVGFAKPKFSTIDKSRTFEVPKAQGVPLQCPAQAYPVPVFNSAPFPCDAEPLSSSKPKLTALDVKSTNPSVMLDAITTLLCPVQGFPVPGFRNSRWFKILVHNAIVSGRFSLVEPVGSTKPKFPMTENSRTLTTYTVQCERSLTLPCPAQAFPVPVFRAGIQCKTKVYERRHKSGATNTNLQRRVDDLPRARVPCPDYTVSNDHPSLTAASIMLSEPTSSVKPKLPTIRKVEFMEARLGSAVNLLCPVQGYPVPISRRDRARACRAMPRGIPFPSPGLGAVFIPFCANPVTEPVATKKPKFSNDAKLSWYDRLTGQDLTLFCPAQGFPVPTYSKAPALTGILKGGWMEGRADDSAVLSCPAQGHPVPSFRTRACVQPLEPIGTKAPAFTSELRGGWLRKRAKSSAVLSCPAQGYPVPAFRVILYPVLEPIGRKAPALTGDMKRGWKEKIAGSSVVLTCPAQGDPVPSFSKAPSILGEKGSLMERRTGTHIVTLCQGQAYPVPTFSAKPRVTLYQPSGRDPLPSIALLSVPLASATRAEEERFYAVVGRCADGLVEHLARSRLRKKLGYIGR
ncbi:hypothetical protein KM043_002939 [Ampulex compressa]|nr:hypothetical protein KM043_002939 [Ampulex compressa]